jgi:uncharacterized membrane protein
MSTFHLTATIAVDRPAAHAWSLLADYERDPAWRAGVATMRPSTTGTVTTDTTTDEDLRFAGRTWRNVGRVTSVEEGRAFTWETTRGADARGARRVDPVDAGTSRVTLDLWVTPHGIERLTAPLLRRMLRSSLRADLDRFKALVEQGDRADQDSRALATRSVPNAVRMAR